MASYKDWKPTFEDLKEINDLLSAASDAVSDAFTALTEDAGMDADIVSSILPQFDYYGTTYVSELHDSFYNRADFNREKARLRRIIKAAESKPRKGMVSPLFEDGNQLTAFYVDEYGNPTQTQYARKEENFLRSQENRRNLAQLQRQGIEFVRQTVTDATGRPIYDENRHKVTVMVPKTPKMMAAYREEIQKNPDKAISYANIPVDGVIDLWGDTAPAVGASKRHYTMAEMMRAVQTDLIADETTTRFFDNYKTLIDTTMPKGISDEIDEYINRIMNLPPSERQRLYERIRDDEDDAGTIEYLYREIAVGLTEKMTNIINYWRANIRTELGMEEMDAAEEDMVQEELLDYGYTAAGIHPIFAEFQIRRKDEPKGTWRNMYRSGGYA